jgi:hypothetical protein
MFWPYAVTLRMAVTFWILLLVPATSNETVWLSLLYLMLTFCTDTLAFVLQLLKPTVSRTSRPSTPLARTAPASTALSNGLLISS